MAVSVAAIEEGIPLHYRPVPRPDRSLLPRTRRRARWEEKTSPAVKTSNSSLHDGDVDDHRMYQFNLCLAEAAGNPPISHVGRLLHWQTGPLARS